VYWYRVGSVMVEPSKRLRVVEANKGVEIQSTYWSL